MKLNDIKNRLSKKSSAADPSHAFGAEQQTAEEIARQTYHRPAEKTAAADVREAAGAVLSGLRDRLGAAAHAAPQEAAQEPQPTPQSPPQSESPRYIEPDGWYNPFYAPDPPAGSAHREPAYAANAYREPPYAQTAYQQPMYEQQPYQQPMYTEPPYQQPMYAETQYQQSVYEQQPYQQPIYEQPYQQNIYEQAPYQQPIYADPIYAEPPYQQQPEYAPPAYTTGENYRPPRSVRPRRELKPGELKYYLWSGAIVGGVALTVISFIYACFL